MSASKNEILFYKAYKNISLRASDAYRDYRVAVDVASMVPKPQIPDFPGSKDVMVVEKQMEMYNALQVRVRFYKERWVRLTNSAYDTYNAWVNIVEANNDND